MNKKTKYIDDLFKEQLGGYTEAPPPHVWGKLEEKLSNKPPQGTGYSRRRLSYFGVLSLIFLSGVVVCLQLTGALSTHTKQFSSKENASGYAAPVSSNTKTNVTQPGNEKKPVVNNEKDNDQTDNKTGNSGNLNASQTQIPESGNTVLAKTKKRNSSGDPAIVKKINTAGAEKGHGGNKISNTSRDEKAKRALAYNGKNGNKSGPNAEDDQPENEYASAASGHTEGDRSKRADDQNITDKKQLEALNKVAKKTEPTVKTNVSKNDDSKHIPKPKFKRFEAGIKAGYETGFNNDAAKKMVVSPYIQYKITSRLGVMFQPSIKNSYLSSRRIGNTRSYYKINGDSSVVKGSSNPVYGVDATTPLFYITKYQYHETRDIVVKSEAVSGTYMELELPVLLKYYLSKKLSVYGGVNIVYSKLLGITEHTNIGQPITTSKDTFAVSATIADAHPLPIRSVISYSGTPISGYTGPAYPPATEDQFRFGYMFGFSYEYSKRWLIDALIQQATASQNMQGGYNTNTALSAPYIRFTLGYKLAK